MVGSIFNVSDVISEFRRARHLLQPYFQSPDSPGPRIYARILLVYLVDQHNFRSFPHVNTYGHLFNSYDDRHDVFDMTENKRHLQYRNAGLREVVSLSFFASNPNAHKSGFNSWR